MHRVNEGTFYEIEKYNQTIKFDLSAGKQRFEKDNSINERV